MTFTNPGQAESFLGALLLGAAAGVFYDLLRVMRARLGGRLLSALLDLMFWLGTVGMLFCYAVWAGNGLVRLYMMAAMLGGGALYFAALSRPVLGLGFRLADFVHLCWVFFTLPGRFFLRCTKKIWKISKNLFHYWNKWVKIKMISNGQGEFSPQTEIHIGAYQNESTYQVKTGKLSDQGCCGGSAGLYGDYDAQSESQDPRRSG